MHFDWELAWHGRKRSERRRYASGRRAPGRGSPDWIGKLVLYVGLAAVLLYAIVLLAPVWVLLFGSVLVAVFLDGAAWLLRAKVFRNRLPDHQLVWVVIVVLLLLGTMTALGFLLGPQVVEQFRALAEQLPRALEQLKTSLTQHVPAVGGLLNGGELERLLKPSSEAGRRIAQVFGSLAGAFGSAAIVLVIGFYFAVQPKAYVRGLVALVPRQSVSQAESVLDATGRALQKWLLGRLCSMAAVAVLTTLALWILDVPLALSLGLLAGLFTFIPFIGPLLSAVPAVLLGFLDSELMALWIAVAYVVVQFIEGNLLTPLIQSYAVSLKPAVLLGAQLVAGSLFGFPGIIIATPLAVVATVFVQVLYVRGHLSKEVRVMGSGGRDD